MAILVGVVALLGAVVSRDEVGGEDTSAAPSPPPSSEERCVGQGTLFLFALRVDGPEEAVLNLRAQFGDGEFAAGMTQIGGLFTGELYRLGFNEAMEHASESVSDLCSNTAVQDEVEVGL